MEGAALDAWLMLLGGIALIVLLVVWELTS